MYYLFSYTSIVVLVWYLISNPNLFPSAVAIALTTNYVFAVNKLSLAGSRIKKFAQFKGNVEDLFLFIRNFGKQSYPVIDKDTLNKPVANLNP